MLKKDSILSIITISFVVSILLIISLFYLLNNNLKLQQYKYMENRVSYFNHKSMMDIEDELTNLGYIQLKETDDILKKAEVLYHTKRGRKDIKYLSYDKKFYIYFTAPRGEVLLQDKKFIKYNKRVICIIFIVVIFIIIALYIIVIKKLLPLKKLIVDIKSLADEKFDTNFDIKGNDEIAILAKEFQKSAKKLKKLKLSREIFIRNIMHELKTPIAKGKFLLNLPNERKIKEHLEKVFYRLQNLLDEFLQIEKFLSLHQNLNFKDYYLDDLIDSAVDISFYEESYIKKEYSNLKLSVDFKLFIVALKNLLDNGIKYSEDKKVTIKTKDRSILLINNGESLKYPIEKYFEPSYDEKTNRLSLGIYIANYILKANQYNLRYKFQDKKNIFIIAPN